MNQFTAHRGNDIRNAAELYLAFELGNKTWKLGFTVGFAQRPRQRTIAAGDLAAIEVEIALAKKRFGLSEESRVVSCYEAGRDGFWLHRYLMPLGVRNLVVDSSSIEVNCRARRAKTDKMDVGKLLAMLIRYDQGEKKLWSVVRVPTLEQEDRRQLGALAGLTPTPYQRGDGAWERGISKCGNRYIRSIAIEIAWDWLRYQPHSKLTRWYQERFAHGSPRLRRIGIVALARKLLIELWRYVETGVIPEGAVMKGQQLRG